MQELRKCTDKLLFFNAAISHISFDNPISQSQVAPTTNGNTIYDVHIYPPSSYNMRFFRLVCSLLQNVQFYSGEFNSGYKYGANLSKNKLMKYIKLFHKSKIFGWALWRWYYTQDSYIPAFNLTNMSNGKFSSNVNFFNLVETVRGIYVQ